MCIPNGQLPEEAEVESSIQLLVEEEPTTPFQTDFEQEYESEDYDSESSDDQSEPCQFTLKGIDSDDLNSSSDEEEDLVKTN